MAIAYDATSGSSSSSSASLTYSHTCSGSNRLLFTSVFTTNGDQVTGVTYNGVSMTQVNKQQLPAKSEYVYLYYLIAPATGANNVVISYSGSPTVGRSVSASYTGCKQSGVPDAQTTNSNTTSTSITTSVTTIANRCWTILTGYGDGGGTTASTGSTERGTQGAALGLYDSNAAITPAALTSMTITMTSGTNATVMASFAPYLETITITDTSTMTDTITTLRQVYSTILDTTTLSEIVAVAKGKFTTILEEISLTEIAEAVLKWLRQTKNTSTLTEQTKNTSIWTNNSMNSSTFDNQNKN